MAHFYSIASLFAYAGFLAVDNGWAEDEDSAGFVVGVTFEVNSDTVPAGEVNDQSPAAGEMAALGSEIDYTISIGPEQVEGQRPPRRDASGADQQQPPRRSRAAPSKSGGAGSPALPCASQDQPRLSRCACPTRSRLCPAG